MKQRLIEIIKVLKQVVNETGLNISDDTILIQSATYHRGELSQENRVSTYQKDKIVSQKPFVKELDNNKPSYKQVYALKNLDYSQEDIDKLTKKEAIDIIKKSRE